MRSKDGLAISADEIEPGIRNDGRINADTKNSEARNGSIINGIRRSDKKGFQGNESPNQSISRNYDQSSFRIESARVGEVSADRSRDASERWRAQVEHVRSLNAVLRTEGRGSAPELNSQRLHDVREDGELIAGEAMASFLNEPIMEDAILKAASLQEVTKEESLSAGSRSSEARATHLVQLDGADAAQAQRGRLLPNFREHSRHQIQPDAKAQEPVIRVTIGRIEVRASHPPLKEKGQPTPSQTQPRISLKEYLSKPRR
jgi:hypothetical protein